MPDWVYEKGGLIFGSGELIKKGLLIKFKHVDDLRFKIKGKLNPSADVSESVKDILYFDLGVEELGINYIPITLVENINTALWEINIDLVDSAKMNNKELNSKKLLKHMGQMVKDGQKPKKIYMKILGHNQAAVINLKISKGGLNGEVELKAPVSEKDAEKLGKSLWNLRKYFKRPETRMEKKKRTKDGDGGGPVRKANEPFEGFYITPGSGRL